MNKTNATIQATPVHYGSRGFTLLEILVASVITTLIMVTAVSALRSVTRSRNKLDNITTAKSELRFAADMIRRDLANIYRETKPDPKMRDFRLLRGRMIESETDIDAPPTCSLTLFTTTRTAVRNGQPESDIVQVEYILRQNLEDKDAEVATQNQGRSRLLRRTLPNPFAQKTSQGTLTALADNIVGFKVRYMAGNKNQWQESWNSKTKLPDLVEIALAAQVPNSRKIIKNSFLVNFPRFGKIESTENNKKNKENRKR